MVQALQKSLFFQRCVAPKSADVVNGSVVLVFVSTLGRQEIMKKCTQTFPKCGRFTSHRVTDKGPPATPVNSGQHAGSEQPLGPAQSTPAPETTLARRSGVEDIKQLAVGLSPAEYHSLAVFFGLKYMQHARVSTVGGPAANLAQKIEAAHVFAEAPATEWSRLLTEYSAKAVPLEGTQCKCRCGCGVLSGGTIVCRCCNRMCCLHCHPANQQSKTSVAMRPYITRNNDVFDG